MLISLQENLLVLLAFDPERASVIRGLVDPAHWGGPYRIIAARIYAHLDSFKKPPGEHLPDILSDKLESASKGEGTFYGEIIENLHAAKDGINAVYVMSQLETFIKRQSLRSAAVDLHKALQRDTEESLQEATRIMASANKTTLSVFDPGTRLSDKKRALRFLDLTQEAFPTGIAELDKRGFGPTRKELWLLIANTKAGKCIAKGEPVLLADGSYVPIEKVGNAKVISADERNKKFADRSAILTPNGRKNILRVVTRTGRILRLTANHRLLTKGGWKKLSSIKIGEKIAAPRTFNIWGSETESKEWLRILGYLIADGGMTKTTTPTFTKSDPVIVADFAQCASAFACFLTPDRGRAGNYWVTSNWKENKISTRLRADGLMGKKSNEKFIPNYIFRLKKPLIAEFLSALFACDGSIYERAASGAFEYSTTSELLARQVDHLFSRFGIVAKTRERWQLVAGKSYRSWSIIITDRPQFGRFAQEFNLPSIKGDKLRALVKKFGTKSNRLGYLSNDRCGDLFYDAIKSIEPDGIIETYDLAVDEHHNFVTGNLLVHNSWALGQLAKAALMHRLKVLHITLEMSESRAAQRYFQALFAISKRKEVISTTRFQKDALGRISGFDELKITPKYSLDDPNIRKKLEGLINRASTRLLDNILIKEFPTGQLTVSQLTAYLDNLESTEKFVPDLLIVDYPDLMKLDRDNFRLALDDTFKGLRGLAVSRNIALAAVSQSHRGAAKAKKVDIDNVAEAYSKIAHSDTVITYTQTPQEQKLGLARLFVAAGRNDQDKMTIVISQAYATGQFVVDSTIMKGVYWENLPASEDTS